MKVNSVVSLMFLSMWLMSLPAVALPSVAPFPLELKRFPEKEGIELQKLFPMLVRGSDAAVPDAAKMSVALAELKRKDCDREDACLSQLATLAGTLYAVHVVVDLTTDMRVIAVGRVVRYDGVATGGVQTVEVPKGARAVGDVGREVVKELLQKKLAVGGLSATRPVDVTPLVVVPKVQDPLWPMVPPIVVADPDEGRRALGRRLIFGGAGLTVLGLACAGAGAAFGFGADLKGGSARTNEAAQQLATGKLLTTVGFAGAGIGVFAALVGATLRGTADEAPVIAVSPVVGGGLIQLGGEF